MADALLMAKPQNPKEPQADDQNLPPPVAVEVPNHQIATSGMAASAPESAPPLAVGGGQNGFLAAQMVLMKNEQELRKSEIA